MGINSHGDVIASKSSNKKIILSDELAGCDCRVLSDGLRKEEIEMTLGEVIIYIIERRPGISDRELSEAIFGSNARHQQVSAECRLLANRADIIRRPGAGSIGNFAASEAGLADEHRTQLVT
jgi:hypothetical protein